MNEREVLPGWTISEWSNFEPMAKGPNIIKLDVGWDGTVIVSHKGLDGSSCRVAFPVRWLAEAVAATEAYRARTSFQPKDAVKPCKHVHTHPNQCDDCQQPWCSVCATFHEPSNHPAWAYLMRERDEVARELAAIKLALQLSDDDMGGGTVAEVVARVVAERTHFKNAFNKSAENSERLFASAEQARRDALDAAPAPEALRSYGDALAKDRDEWKRAAEMYRADAIRDGEAIEAIRKILGTTVHASKVPELVRLTLDIANLQKRAERAEGLHTNLDAEAALVAMTKDRDEQMMKLWSANSRIDALDEISDGLNALTQSLRNERDEARAQLGSTIEHSARIAKDRDNFETKFEATAKDRDEWAEAIRSVAPGYISSAHAAKAAIAEMKVKWDAAETSRMKLQDFQADVAYELGAERNPDLALDALKARLKELAEYKQLGVARDPLYSAELQQRLDAVEAVLGEGLGDHGLDIVELAKLLSKGRDDDQNKIDTASDILCMALGADHGRGGLVEHAQKAAEKLKLDDIEAVLLTRAETAEQNLTRAMRQLDTDHTAHIRVMTERDAALAKLAEAQNRIGWYADHLADVEEELGKSHARLASAERVVADGRAVVSVWMGRDNSEVGLGTAINVLDAALRAHNKYSSGSAEQSGVAQREQSNEGTHGPLDRPAPKPAGTTVRCNRAVGWRVGCNLPPGHAEPCKRVAPAAPAPLPRAGSLDADEVADLQQGAK